MSSDEQAPASGSVPAAFGNALSWKWTRQMSPYLRRSGLPLLLCQLRNFASASGEVAFASDRKPIRIQDIAKAACCDEKECRRYLEAAMRAGVVQVIGERKRGKPARYVIVVNPFPQWQDAEDYLRSTARKRGTAWGPKDDGSSGDSAPNQNGGQSPELSTDPTEEVRGTAPRMCSGDSPPNGSGDSAPNNPGGFHVSTQDGAEVGSQPQVVGAPEDEPEPHEHHHPTRPDAGPAPAATAGRCRRCQIPLIRSGRHYCAGCEHYLANHPDTGRHTA